MRLEADAGAVNLVRRDQANSKLHTKTVVPAPGSIGTPLLGFAAFSGTGKTTLLCALIPLLRAQGLRLALIKHSHHAFEIDRPGKDSYRLRQAGATQVVLASRRRVVTQRRYRADEAEPDLADFARWIDRPGLDLLLVEGYKHAAIPKIELYRDGLGHPLLARDDRSVIAVAADRPLSGLAVPQLDINRPAAIAAFITDRFLASPRDRAAPS